MKIVDYKFKLFYVTFVMFIGISLFPFLIV